MLIFRKKRIGNIDNIALFICSVLIIYLSYNTGVSNILTWDIFGHYVYLPMIFNKGKIIHENLEYFDQINVIYKNTPYFYQFVQVENGHFITKYTSGWAIVLSPFYFIANLVCRFTGYKNDGFSLPYQYIISFGVTFYTLMGLFYLKKIISYLYKEQIAAFVLIIIVFGTNFLFMNYVAKGSSNNIEFTFVALMIWQTIQFHNSYKLKYAIGIGVSIALIGLIRPPDLVLVLIPLGWNIKNYGTLKKKLILFWITERKKIVISITIAFLLLFVQFLYWKLCTGHLLMNSYSNNPGEGFDWFNPHIIEVLFSFRKGWFLYTPIMIFAVIGLFQWGKNNNIIGHYPFIAFLIFLYLVSCWTTWWYADSFSQRSLIDIYPLLAIGLATFINELFMGKKAIYYTLIFLILIGFNLFQTYQIDRGIIHTSRMTKDYYFSIFGQINPPSEKQKNMLLIDRETKYFSGFDDKDNYQICYVKGYKFPKNTKINKESPYSPIIDIQSSVITKQDHFWLKAVFEYEGNYEQLKGKIFNTAAMYHHKSYQYSGQYIEDSLIHYDTIKKEVVFEYLSPEFRTKDDIVRVNVFYESGAALILKRVRIICYHKK
ncbi:MAG: hypothetical protein HYR91_07745 [Flavobacteriia bacterium]|nr:hypothetical protein [Flavobacteriia bacterium]